MAKRCPLEIQMDILKLLERDPRLITHLMYGSNLSFGRCRMYTDKLVRLGLLSTKRGVARNGQRTVYYTTTETGRKLLQQYKQFLDVLK